MNVNLRLAGEALGSFTLDMTTKPEDVPPSIDRYVVAASFEDALMPVIQRHSNGQTFYMTYKSIRQARSGRQRVASAAKLPVGWVIYDRKLGEVVN